MYIEQPWRSERIEIAHRTATVKGLRMLADVVEDDQLTVDEWSGVTVHVKVVELQQLRRLVTKLARPDHAQATMWTSTVQVSITVAGVQAFEGAKTLDATSRLNVVWHADDAHSTKVLTGFHPVYPYVEGEVEETYELRINDSVHADLAWFLGDRDVQLVDSRRTPTADELEESRIRALARAATYVAEQEERNRLKQQAETEALDAAERDRHMAQVVDEDVEAVLEDRALDEADVEPF